ncbi:MAG: class III cytochrome C family protein [Phycisphaerae bacterium]|nr:class III cytochrome C family protein [Phycisphaerae bacterium]|tara:strand:+ start:122 stop:895 length:774 start_codon:yes stop_codon:yes gene_type:complete
MKKLEVIYGVVTLGGLGFAFSLPLFVHRGGADAAPGWQEFVSPGPLTEAHAFLGNDCTSCHTPHIGVTASNCIACHANDEELLSQPETAFHASVGSCVGCHAEHQSPPATPTAMDHDLFVEIAQSGASNDAQVIIESIRAHARAMPTPHPRISSSELALDCASCHANEDPHRTLFGTSCASCHSTLTWNIPEYRHPSPMSMNCAQCHSAPPSHYMGHFKMVSKRVAGIEHAEVTDCFKCHRTNSWNEIPRIGWYKHH